MGPTYPCYGGPGQKGPASPEVLTPISGGESATDDQATPSGTGSATSGPPECEPGSVPDSLVLAPGAEPVPGYRLIERLGRGGYGEVWKASGPGDFLVALKFVALGGQTGPVELRSLNLIKNIRHPHLLTLFGSWQVGGYLALAMELGERTLHDRFNQVIAAGAIGIPGPELVEAMMDAARGLDYLNEPRHPAAEGGEPVGIQHRDIKPHNLMLVGGCVKVADFGLARILRGTHTGHTGSLTPSFAAPEFFRNETSRHSDQYSLAVTYCVLRGGRLPFTGSIEQIIAGHLLHSPDLSMLPEAERPIVSRALDKDPGQRWSSCKAFVEQLRTAILATPQEAAPTMPHPGTSEPRIPEPTTEPQIARVPSTSGHGRLLGRVLLVTIIAGGLVLFAVSRRDPRITAPVHDRRLTTKIDVPDRTTPPTFAPGEIRLLDSPEEPVACLALSPDGRQAVGGDQGGRVRLWDLDTGRSARLLGRWNDRVAAIAFAPNGRKVVAAGGVNPFLESDRPLRIWDLPAGEETIRCDAPAHRTTALAVSPDGRRVVSGGADGTLRVCELERPGEVRRSTAHGGAITCLAVSPDGARILSGAADGSVILWELGKLEILHRLDGHRSGILAVAFLGNGDRAASASGPVPFREESPCLRVWDLSAQSERTRVELPAATTCLAFSAEGRDVLLGGADNSLRLWDVEQGREAIRLESHPGLLVCVELSPDGRLALAGSIDGTLRLWRLKP